MPCLTCVRHRQFGFNRRRKHHKENAFINRSAETNAKREREKKVKVKPLRMGFWHLIFWCPKATKIELRTRHFHFFVRLQSAYSTQNNGMCTEHCAIVDTKPRKQKVNLASNRRRQNTSTKIEKWKKKRKQKIIEFEWIMHSVSTFWYESCVFTLIIVYWIFANIFRYIWTNLREAISFPRSPCIWTLKRVFAIWEFT